MTVSHETPRPTLTPEHLVLGVGMLALTCDWDAWVARRVDTFSFRGDDERVLTRQQSIDFQLPVLANRFEEMTRGLGGTPVPITFVNKWRLPQFSLRDETGAAVPLLSRQEAAPIAVGMLVALGNFLLRGNLLPNQKDFMPVGVQRLLADIVVSDADDAVRCCAELGVGESCHEDTLDEWWRDRLASSESFMGLAYELARGFLLTALCPSPTVDRKILKFSYNSFVVSARRDRRLVRIGHAARAIRQGSRDATESAPGSSRRHRGSGEVVFSTSTGAFPDGPHEGGRSVACVRATLVGPRCCRRTMRLRTNTAVAFRHLPSGTYTVSFKAYSGFMVESDKSHVFTLGENDTKRIHVRTQSSGSGKRPTLAQPLIARPATRLRTIMRGLAWYSKPLVIRVRIGDGGSYHCEFEAPEGLHVTRARLVSDAKDDGHELALALESQPRAHLYAPAEKTKPAAAYVYLNLRPRVETIARPAFWTACAATIVLLFLALLWNTNTGLLEHGPPDGTALLTLLLGAPSALAAYFAQAVPSRVTNSILYGVRLLALLPATLALAAGGVVLVGQHEPWASCALWTVFGLSIATIAALHATQYLAEHPLEQRHDGLKQPQSRAQQNSKPIEAGIGELATKMSSADGQPENATCLSSDAVRDLMLGRARGLAEATRRTLFAQRTVTRRTVLVPPALYFDSAETPPSFLGLASDDQLGRLRSQVHRLIGNPGGGAMLLQGMLLAEPASPTLRSRPPTTEGS